MPTPDRDPAAADAAAGGVEPVLELAGVRLTRGGRHLLDGVDWRVDRGTSWVVLGANGSGKTSLVRIAALYEHPSRGRVRVLGEELGRCDIRSLRRRVSLVSPALVDLVRGDLDALDVVVAAKHAALEPWWHHYDDADRDRAAALLGRAGVGHAVGRRFASLSSGERQRVLLARALMPDPGLVLLDEPTAGLDLAGREELVERLDALAGDPTAPPVVLVTHHVEEIPPSFGHLLVLHAGRVLRRGALPDALDDEVLGEAFGLPLRLGRDGGRWWARRA